MHNLFKAWIPSLNKMSWEFSIFNKRITYDYDMYTCKEIDINEVYMEIKTYIGIDDINRKHIFKDDIVKVTITDIDERKRIVIGFIDFLDGTFDVAKLSHDTGHKVWMGIIPESNLIGTHMTFEILGNIRQNIELLEECVFQWES